MKNVVQMIKQCVEKEEPYFLLRGQDLCANELMELYMNLIGYSVTSLEYKKTLDAIRKIEMGEHTLGLNLSLEPVTQRGIVDYSISKIH